VKKTILTVIQVLVTVGILFWVFHDPVKRHQMWEALIHARPAWLLAGTSGCENPVLSAWRANIKIRRRAFASPAAQQPPARS